VCVCVCVCACVGGKERSAVPATVRWTAPEILAQPNAEEETSTGRDTTVFSAACDVYSLAIVLWELATFSDPFADVADDSQVRFRHFSITDIITCNGATSTKNF